MKKHIFLAMLLAPTSIWAQNIYKAERFTSEDLVGTARYVAMGGAMNVLGADISAMGINPASSALFRHSNATFTLDFTNQKNAKEFNTFKANRLSVDQGGFIYSNTLYGRKLRFINFGFNFQKRKNFKQYLGAINQTLGNTSQTYTFANLGSLYGQDYYTKSANGNIGFNIPLLDAAYNSFMVDPTIKKEGKKDIMTDWKGINAEQYTYQREQHGGIQQYDFNVGLNFSEQYFFGVTLGLYSVRQESNVGYQEIFKDKQNKLHPYNMWQSESINGSGVDFKIGSIIRPIASNPLRIGIAFSSPTWFELSSAKYVTMRSPFVAEGSKEQFTRAGYDTNTYDWNLRTPWKLNVGVATTLASCVALDLEYQYENFKQASIAYPEGDTFVDYYNGSYWRNKQKDVAMNHQIDKYLLGVHTLRLGVEGILNKNWSLRFGFNHSTAPIKKSAFRNLYANAGTSYQDSPSLYNLTGTDYVNFGAISNISTGVGYHRKHFFVDLAYVFRTQDADIYPFHDTTEYTNDTQIAANGMQPYSTNIKENRIIMTLGYRF